MSYHHHHHHHRWVIIHTMMMMCLCQWMMTFSYHFFHWQFKISRIPQIKWSLIYRKILFCFLLLETGKKIILKCHQVVGKLKKKIPKSILSNQPLIDWWLFDYDQFGIIFFFFVMSNVIITVLFTFLFLRPSLTFERCFSFIPVFVFVFLLIVKDNNFIICFSSIS